MLDRSYKDRIAWATTGSEKSFQVWWYYFSDTYTKVKLEDCGSYNAGCATFLLAAVVLYFIIGSVTNNDFGLPPSKVCETQIDYRKIIVLSANSGII